MDVPMGSADSSGIPLFPLSEVRKVTHLNAGKLASRNIRRSITVATAVLRNTFDGMWVANLRAVTSVIV
jgi:hypothetical protein